MDTSIGAFSTITSDQVISSVKMNLRIETSDDDMFFDRLVNEGVRHLDALSIFVKKECKLKVNDRKAKLPNGFHKLIGLRGACNQQWTNLIYVDSAFLNSCGCDCDDDASISSLSGSFQIQNGYIYITNTRNLVNPNTLSDDDCDCADDLEWLSIAYWGLNVDEYGVFVVREDYERALVAYCCWKYCQQNFDKYPNNLAKDYEAEWKAQKRWVKSSDVVEKFRLTKREFASIMNSIVKAKVWEM